MPANNRSLRQARNMINGLVADGGTEMLGALRFALNQTHDENTLNQIVFITDGSIGNETALFKLIQTQLGDRRLFTIGIGSAPNAYFMRKAAKFGRGTYTFIGYNDDVNQLMGDLFIKMSRPVLKDIQIDWGKQQVETYPKRIPDLYLSEPLMVVTKSNQPLTEIKIKGSLLGKDWLRSINNKKTENDNADNLDTVWARSKVTHLMDKMVTGELSQQEAKPEIIQLGIAHQIVTKFTSFVAIEKTPSRPFTEKAKHKLVPNLMPKGNAMQAPQTSTPAALLSLIGGLLILLSQISRRVANRYKLQGGKS